jgi:RNA polymerase sigma factor (sigma-70 family)
VQERAKTSAAEPLAPAVDLDEVYQQEGARLWRAMFAFTAGRRDIAEDAIAEAFTRAIERSGTIRDPVPWIYRTALNVAVRELKRERTTDPLAGDHTAEATEPDQGLAELVWALRELSPNQRVAVVLFYEEGLSTKEVADLMGAAVPTVKVHLHRGRNRIRTLLSDRGPDDA